MKKNKIFKVELKILNFIQRHIDMIMLIALLFLSLIIRIFLLPNKSQDYIHFLNPWYETLKNGGGLKALANYPGDYNAPYMTILALLTYIKINPIISIKMISILFDYLLAFVVGKFIYDFLENSNNKKMFSIIGGATILFLPTVLLNGAYWAQCDVIYTTFVVLALYYLYKEKITTSFILLGLAFAFKLQFIFILPVYIILYASNKNFSILNFFLIPIINFILCLPTIIAGKPVIECMLVYFNQTNTYKEYLTLNVPNFFSIVNGDPKYLSKIGIILLVFIFAILLYIIIKRKIKIDKEKMLLLSIISIITCNFFLPYMHERYMFTGVIISIIYAFIYRKNWLVALGLELISICSYAMFLFQKSGMPTYVLATIYSSIIIYLIYNFIRYEKK